jgi:hypothetical protein
MKIKLKQKLAIKQMLVSTAIGAMIFLFSLTPLILFDFKHDGLNRKAFTDILIKEDAFKKENIQGSNSISQFFLDLKDRSELILVDISIGEHSRNLNFFVALIVLFAFFWRIKQLQKKGRDISAELILSSFLITGILGTAFYKQNIYEHYIAYLFPVTFFTLGIMINYLISKKIWGFAVVTIFLILFAKFNYNHAKVILRSLGWTIAHIQAVAKTIEDRVGEDEKYNIVLLNATGDIYGQNYRYFLTASSKPPVPEERFGEVESLFIIDEERKVDREVDSPVYQIVTFPNKVPVEVYTIPNGPEITVLRIMPK